MQGVPSFPTVHWTVGKFTLCGAPKGCIDLRSTWDSVPNPARGAASGLCKRGIAPFETRCCRLRRLGTPSQTLPEALPLDSAKGALPLLKPGFAGCADLGRCPKPRYCAGLSFSTMPLRLPASPASPCISLGIMIFVAFPSAAFWNASSDLIRITFSDGSA